LKIRNINTKKYKTMAEEFFLLLSYKGKTLKFKVSNPTDSLGLLMDKLKGTGVFDMPAVDPSGAPINYYFGKPDENGQAIILNPKVGKTEQYLHDYNVNSGDSLLIIYEPIAG